MIDFGRLRSHLGPNLDPTWTQVGAQDGSKSASGGVRRRHVYKMIKRVETWSEWASQEGPNPWGMIGADRVPIGFKICEVLLRSPRTLQEALQTPLRAPQERPRTAQERPKSAPRAPQDTQERPKSALRRLSWLDFGSNLGLCSTSQTPKTINLGPMFGRSALKTRPTFEINPSQVYLTRCAATVPRLRVQ